jgi:hypothetical protein
MRISVIPRIMEHNGNGRAVALVMAQVSEDHGERAAVLLTAMAIIAVIEILLRENGDDKYAQGGLSLAHAHLDGQKPRQPLCTRGGPWRPLQPWRRV